MAKIKSNGFTLIELIIVIVIFGIVTTGAISLLLQGITKYRIGRDYINANWQASLAIERMIRDLHEVLSIAVTSASNKLEVKDIYGVDISYAVDEERKRLLRNTKVLADEVESITFTYYDLDGKVIDKITDNNKNDIRYIGISLNIIYEKASGFPTDIAREKKPDFSTTVALWNVK